MLGLLSQLTQSGSWHSVLPCCPAGADAAAAGPCPALPGGGCALVPLGMRGREGQGRKRRLGNAARALWRPPLAGTRGMGARGVYLGTQQCCRQAPHAALLLRNALNLYSILMLPLNPRETTSATVKNEGYSYCCQSLAFGASEVLKTWKRY